MKRRPRVLFTIGSMSGGGSERQMIGILKRIDRRRFEPLLYLIYHAGELLPEVPADIPLYTCEGRCGLPKFYFPGRIHRRSVRDLANLLREQQVDLVYDRTWHATLIAAGATALTRVPRLSTIVTDPRQDFERTAGRFRRIKYRVLRKAYRTADRVLAVSNGVANDAADYYQLDRTHVTTLYNFLDLERIDDLLALDNATLSDGDTDPQWPGTPQPDRFHIVTAGRLHEQKGIIHLLHAVQHLATLPECQHLRLHILGDGPLESQFKAFVAANNLTGHVRFAGFQGNPIRSYRAAQLFCLPSLYEGMPNALLEAMACRVPVLSTDCPSGPREVLSDGRFGRLVPPANADALAVAIRDCMLNYATWRNRTTAARFHIEQQFSPTAGIRNLETIIEATLARRTP